MKSSPRKYEGRLRRQINAWWDVHKTKSLNLWQASKPGQASQGKQPGGKPGKPSSQGSQGGSQGEARGGKPGGSQGGKPGGSQGKQARGQASQASQGSKGGEASKPSVLLVESINVNQSEESTFQNLKVKWEWVYLVPPSGGDTGVYQW